MEGDVPSWVCSAACLVKQEQRVQLIMISLAAFTTEHRLVSVHSDTHSYLSE